MFHCVVFKELILGLSPEEYLIIFYPEGQHVTFWIKKKNLQSFKIEQ
jgi:hypothetical protein